MLYPAISYPTYEMGAILAGCRPVAGARRRAAGGSTSAPSTPADAARALCLWVNSPGNPTGALDDLGAAAAWGRAHGVPVFSDECYVEFTWDGPPRTILEHGLDGVVAVHSLSKRSNLAGLRVGFYAGDAELCSYLQEVRKHVGHAGARPGAGRRRRPPWPTTTTSSRSATATVRRLETAGRGPARAGRASRWRCPQAASTSGSTSATPGRSPSSWRQRAERW